MKTTRIRSGFSLVELLAVVAIIIILLALLMPVMTLMKQRTDSTTCIGNLRQVILATNVYTTDNDGRYPDAWRWVWSDPPSSSDWTTGWIDWAQPETITKGVLYQGKFLVDKKAYLCPTFKKGAATWNPAFANLTPQVGYSMNEYTMSWSSYTTWNGRNKLLRQQIEMPSAMGIFADEGVVPLPWAPVIINNLCMGVGNISIPGNLCDGIAAFHNVSGDNPRTGQGNVAFADGHAATVDPSKSVLIFTPPNYRPKP